MLKTHRGRILVRAVHGFGLGDSVMFTSTLKHVARSYPKLRIVLECLPERFGLYRGLVDELRAPTEGDTEDEFDERITMPWRNQWTCLPGTPSTPAEQSLLETWGLSPSEPLCRYAPLTVTCDDLAWADEFLATCAPGPVCVIHPSGVSFGPWKNLQAERVGEFCEWLYDLGIQPLVMGGEPPGWLDLLDHVTVERLSALMRRAALYVGCPSGPAFIAAQTATPALVVWREPSGGKIERHPIHYFHPAANVTHLVPDNHADMVRTNRFMGLDYFGRAYRSIQFPGTDWLPTLKQAAEAAIGGGDAAVPREVRSDLYD